MRREMCCSSLLSLMSVAAGKPGGKLKTINATNKSLPKRKLFTCLRLNGTERRGRKTEEDGRKEEEEGEDGDAEDGDGGGCGRERKRK